ncbi:MAG: hypothetical protein Q4C18_05280 [Eubacteriales bacterium]|nr:hypothetical protein [Eubacteriales bacterium]
MAKVIVRLNRSGVRELLKSSELQSRCIMHAQRIQRIAGEHYTTESRTYPERNGASVYPADDAGYYDNLNNNTLVKAMGEIGGSK